MPWSSSNRRARLPQDWPAIRRRVLTRDPTCRCSGCRRCTPTGCARPSTDVDHITAGDDHAHLRGMCRDCHAVKSSDEGHAAKPRRTRPPERHPGLL